MIMKKKSNFAFILIILIFLLNVAFAQIAVTVNTEKEFLYENEIQWINVKVINDSNQEIEKVNLKIEGTNKIKLIKEFEEQNSILDNVGPIRAGGAIEKKYKIKQGNGTENVTKIFIYHSLDNSFNNVTGTYFEKKFNPIKINSKFNSHSAQEGQRFSVDLEIQNLSSKEIGNFASELLVPQGFTNPKSFFVNIIEDGNNTSHNFETIVAPHLKGTHTLILTYGYFDEFGPHYFEERFDATISQSQIHLAVIGVLILIIAVWLYINQRKDSKHAKQTEKWKEETVKKE